MRLFFWENLRVTGVFYVEGTKKRTVRTIVEAIAVTIAGKTGFTISRPSSYSSFLCFLEGVKGAALIINGWSFWEMLWWG